ncbi:Sodium-dependent neutral amino acid transporter B(0)AT3, partial [Galemys pyrenaicus]
ARARCQRFPIKCWDSWPEALALRSLPCAHDVVTMVRLVLPNPGLEDRIPSLDQLEDLEQAEASSRPKWDNKAQYMLTCVGFCVGLGNVWRFPYLCQSHGGGAFMIPFLILLVVEGIPLLHLEFAIGQRLRKGSVGVWSSIHPALKGVGVASMFVSFMVGFYYNTIIAWVMWYFFNSFQEPLPWSQCPLNENRTGYVDECARSSPVDYFWYRETLNISTSINNSGSVQWWILLCLTCAWSVLYVCTIRGIETTGKAVYITSTLPYVVLTIFLIRGLTLKGATNGIVFLFTPNVTELANPVTWLDAGAQVFYSFSLAFGGLISFSSYNSVHNNCEMDSVIVSIINGFTSVYAATVVYSIIGFRATERYDDCFNQCVPLARPGQPPSCPAPRAHPVWSAAPCPGPALSRPLAPPLPPWPPSHPCPCPPLALALSCQHLGPSPVLPGPQGITTGPSRNILTLMNGFDLMEGSVTQDNFVEMQQYCNATDPAAFAALNFQTCDMNSLLSEGVEGTGLAFIVFTEAITKMPVAPLWAVLFFIMLFCLGLSSMFGNMEGVVVPLQDLKIIPKKWPKELLTGLICLGTYLLAIIFTLNSGQYWLSLLDSYAGSIPLLVIAFCEMFAVVYVYGVDRFNRDIEFMIGHKPNIFWQIMWRVVSPLLMLVILLFFFVVKVNEQLIYSVWDPSYEEFPKSNKVTYPGWVYGVVVVVSGTPCLAIPGFAIYKFIRSRCRQPGDQEGGMASAGGLDPQGAGEDRPQWDNKLQYFLSCLGFAVGLGNIWRFPYLCQSYGGGAFLIPYCIALVFEGIPLFHLELAIGQRLRRGSIGVWTAISPYLGGVGLGCFTVSLLVSLYYNTVLTWVFWYFLNSFQHPLPWSSCPLDGNHTGLEDECGRGSAVSYFWYRRTLNISADIADSGSVQWRLLVCLAASWVLLYLCIIRGIESTGKAIYFTALFPYLVLTIFFVRGLTLPGATEGLIYLFTPDMQTLQNPRVWLDAATQIFFSLSLAFGGHIAFASYNPPRNDCEKDAVSIALVNSLTSLYASITVFSVLGFKAANDLEHCLDGNIRVVLDAFDFPDRSISRVDYAAALAHLNTTWPDRVAALPLQTCRLRDFLDKSASGTGLAFIVFTEAILHMPGAPGWAVLFFAMLFSLGLSSMFGNMEGVITPLLDMGVLPRSVPKEVLTGAVCLGCFLLATCFTLQSGSYWLEVFDSYGAPLNLIIFAFMEVVGVVYVYGVKRFCDDVAWMTGRRPGLYWQLTWKAISPLLLLAILVAYIGLLVRTPPGYRAWNPQYVGPGGSWDSSAWLFPWSQQEQFPARQPKAYPGWVQVVCILLSFLPTLWVPAVALAQLLARRTRSRM